MARKIRPEKLIETLEDFKYSICETAIKVLTHNQ